MTETEKQQALESVAEMTKSLRSRIARTHTRIHRLAKKKQDADLNQLIEAFALAVHASAMVLTKAIGRPASDCADAIRAELKKVDLNKSMAAGQTNVADVVQAVAEKARREMTGT